MHSGNGSPPFDVNDLPRIVLVTKESVVSAFETVVIKYLGEAQGTVSWRRSGAVRLGVAVVVQ